MPRARCGIRPCGSYSRCNKVNNTCIIYFITPTVICITIHKMSDSKKKLYTYKLGGAGEHEINQNKRKQNKTKKKKNRRISKEGTRS